MEKPVSTFGSGGSSVLNTVFIDTSLNTHLAMMVSDSDTVSDLKKKILFEHPLCFPDIGEIKINGIKVKRKGHLYHLSDSMFVKSAFDGMSKNWFLSVDALSTEDHRENHNSSKAFTGNVVACLGVTANNFSADVVDLLPSGTSKALSNINNVSLPEDGNNCHAKQSSASQQFGFSNSSKENSEDLPMEVEHVADSNSKVFFPANNKESRPMVREKDVEGNKMSEDLRAAENGALVVESGKDALGLDNVLQENSFQNGRNAVLNDMNLVERREKRSESRKRRDDEGAKVLGKNSDFGTNKDEDISASEQGKILTEISSKSGPTAKKKRKAVKKDSNENVVVENEALILHFVKQGTQPDAATTSGLGQKVERPSAIFDHLMTGPVEENHLLGAKENDGKKKRKRKKSNVSQASSEISTVKDINVGTFQPIEAINHKYVSSKADRGFAPGKISMGGAISELCPISSAEMQKGRKTCTVTHYEGDADMANTNDDNMENKSEAHELDVASLLKTHERNSLQNDIRVLEDKIVEPKKASKKIKKSKKTRDPVGGEAVDALYDRGLTGDISPAENPTSLTVDLSKNEADQVDKTDMTADVVIRDVLDSLHEHNGPENSENMDKKSRTKTKKKSCTVVEHPELKGKDDFDHQDTTVPSGNVSEVSASSKSRRKTMNVKSLVATQLNGSDFRSKNNRGVEISPVHTQLDSSQTTSKSYHEVRPIQDINHPKSVLVDGADKSIEVPCQSERIKIRNQNKIVDSCEMLIDKATNEKGVETEVKEKKKLRKPDVQSRPDLPSFQMSNGNPHKEAKTQDEIQSQRSSSKVKSHGSNVRSSKTLLTITGCAAKEHVQTIKSGNTNCIPKEAQRPIDISSSRVYTDVEKNNTHVVSSSTLERSKDTTSLNKRGHKNQSHLDIAKATGSNNGKVVNSLENKKSLLGIAGTIFKHDDNESSDEEYGVDNSDGSTRTPSGSSSASDYSDSSDVNQCSSRTGSYSSGEEEGGKRNRKEPRASSTNIMPLHAILSNSSRYKKAKLTASQDPDSQLDEFVPDSQAT